MQYTPFMRRNKDKNDFNLVLKLGSSLLVDNVWLKKVGPSKRLTFPRSIVNITTDSTKCTKRPIDF